MMSAPFSCLLEVDSNALRLLAPATKPRSASYGSSDDDGSIPEMIMSASLQSFPDSDTDSISSSVRSSPLGHTHSPVSPRSIFHAYWSSPTYKKSTEEKPEEDVVLAQLQALQMPLVNDDDNEDRESHKCGAKEAAPLVLQAAHKAAADDSRVDYRDVLRPTPPARTPRRQILPTPPPPTAVSSSLIMPRRRQPLPTYGASAVGRGWSSAAALLDGGAAPRQSCLRKSRYSCSAIPPAVGGTGRLHHGLRNDGHHDLLGRAAPAASGLGGELKKSVSFYSHVSVFEFAVPPEQRRSQAGWSNYFA